MAATLHPPSFLFGSRPPPLNEKKMAQRFFGAGRPRHCRGSARVDVWVFGYLLGHIWHSRLISLCLDLQCCINPHSNECRPRLIVDSLCLISNTESDTIMVNNHKSKPMFTVFDRDVIFGNIC